MSLIVNTLDYSGLYNAFNTRKAGAMAEVRRDANNLEGVMGIEKILMDAGQVAMGIWKDAKVTEAKLDIQALDTQAQQKTRDYILNNSYTVQGEAPKGPQSSLETSRTTQTLSGPVEKGWGGLSIKLPDEFDEWYKQAQEDIKKKYSGFPEVQQWASDQLYRSYDNAKGTALNVFHQKVTEDRAKLEAQLITNSLTHSVQAGDFGFTEAAINSAQSLSPNAKQALRSNLEGQYKYQVKSGELQQVASDAGYEKGLETVQGWQDNKQVTLEEADALRKQAHEVASISAGMWQEKADGIFRSAIEKNTDPELAVKQAMSSVPDAYKGKVEPVLRAAYQQRVNQVDDEADKELLKWHNEHPDDGSGLLNVLRSKEGSYAKRMLTPTYNFWENMGEGILSAQARAAKGARDIVTPQPLLDEALQIVSQFRKTPSRKEKELQALYTRTSPRGQASPWDPKDFNEYLTRAHDEKWTNPDVIDGAALITDTMKVSMQGDQRKKLGIRSGLTQAQAMSSYEQQLGTLWTKGKAPTRDDIAGVVENILHGTKALSLRADQAGVLSGGTANNRYFADRLSGKMGIDDENDQLLRDFQQQQLATVYGMTALPDWDPKQQGIPAFQVTGAELNRIRGISPKDAGAAAPAEYYRIRWTTDAKGNQSLVALSGVIGQNGKPVLDEFGSPITNWEPIKLPSISEQKLSAEQRAQAVQAKKEATAVSAMTGKGAQAIVPAAEKAGLTVPEAISAMKAESKLPLNYQPEIQDEVKALLKQNAKGVKGNLFLTAAQVDALAAKYTKKFQEDGIAVLASDIVYLMPDGAVVK